MSAVFCRRIGLVLSLVLGFCGNAEELCAQSTSEAAGGSDKRQLHATRLLRSVRIDGALELDALGADAQVAGLAAGGFRQNAPQPGAPAKQETFVWLGYDDEALYVFARLDDDAADSILLQLSERDRLRNTDYFGVSINPYRDGINASNFLVTPANVQYDSKFSANDENNGPQPMQTGDESWDAVWASAAQVDSAGWSVELRIPYSMLRFAEGDVQTWDINFARQIRRHREESFWNFVDPKGAKLTTQMGEVLGLQGLKPPIRLQATPFVTMGADHRFDPTAGATGKNATSTAFGGGLDLKYGLSDAFTLDMTLVPDFSNARSDDQILNLSASEIRFDENRAFFTEGVELFNKGNFFYSRRIGGSPINFFKPYEVAEANELVTDNPGRPQLLNATKVSGRLGNGLGIGVFTALEAETRATLYNTVSRQSREVVTAPLTSYNAVALDQNLPNNSFVTLVNTTVLRSGATYDANLTGLTWDLRNKSNVWSVKGRAALTQQYGLANEARNQENTFGHTARLGLERLTGRLRYGFEYNEESDTYNPNDLGFVFFNNERVGAVYAEYNWFEPFGRFNSAKVQGFSEVAYLYKPSLFNYAGSGGELRMTTRDFFTFGAELFSELRDGREFQDTRTPNVGLLMPQWGEAGGFISSDYRKPFALDVRTSFGRLWEDNRTSSTSLTVGPRVRVGDRMTLRMESSVDRNKRFRGYIGHAPAAIEFYQLAKAGTFYQAARSESVGYGNLRPDGILFSHRDITSFENELTIEYSFTANINVNLRVRHYYSRVFHREFFETTSAGDPLPTAYTGRDELGATLHDRSFNAFNVDGFFRWRFAPGSDIFLSYKTQSYYDGYLTRAYLRNLEALNENPISNTLTLKVIYWLDYNALKGKRKM